MTAPTLLPQNTTVLQRLLSEMPSHFSKDPVSDPVLELTISPTLSSDLLISTWTNNSYVTFTIADGTLSIDSSESYILSETLLLSKYSINDLIDYFNSRYQPYGLKAILFSTSSSYDGDFSSTTLLEGIYNISPLFTTVIDKFTSNNYALMMAIALGLIDNTNNMIAALNQTDIRLSSGKWTDFWGALLGIYRLGSEISNDISFRNRIQREVIDKKSNNTALENLITGSTGRESTVVDGGQPFILSGSTNSSPYQPISGSLLPVASTPTISFTGYISGSNLHVTTITNGNSIGPGYVLTSSNVTSGTLITSYSGGSGWVGDYTITPSQNVGSSGSPVTITCKYPVTSSDAAYRTGPVTGAGSFIVYIKLLNGETSLPQDISSSLTTLINQWKSAGISFVIKSM